jgi:hypothetical protein
VYAEGVIGALSIDDCLRTEVIDLFQIPSEVVEEMVQVQRQLESEFNRVPTTKKERLIDTLLSSDTEDTE